MEKIKKPKMQTTIQVIDFRDDRYVRANEVTAAGVKASECP